MESEDRDNSDNANDEETSQDPETLLHREVPMVFNNDIDGEFDPVRAQLILHGLFVAPTIAAVLKARMEKGLRCHVRDSTPAYTSSDSPRVSRDSYDSGCATRGPKDLESTCYGPWTEDDIAILVRSRAERLGFPAVTELFPFKTEKACMSRFYKALRTQGWKPQWRAWRREHDARCARRGPHGDHDTLGEVSSQPLNGAQEAAAPKVKDVDDAMDQEEDDTAVQ